MNARCLMRPSRKDRLGYHGRHQPSITLGAAGAFGFLTLIQSGERPEDRSDRDDHVICRSAIFA
jgi:hypothetical protein